MSLILAAFAGLSCLGCDEVATAPAARPAFGGINDGHIATAPTAIDVGWERMNLPRMGDLWKLNALAFSSPGEGWAVGSDEDSTRGVVLHYANGRWEKDYMPYAGRTWTVHLVDIALSGPREGWAVGDRYYIWSDPDRFKGFLMRMQSGKWKTYSAPNVGRSFNLEGIAIVPGTDVAWAVGGVTSGKRREGLIMRYERRWARVSNPPVRADWWELHDISFPSPNRGWAVGKVVHPDPEDNPLLVIKYQDGKWSQEEVPRAGGLKRSLLAVNFTSPRTGWAAGEGTLLRYRNGRWEREKIVSDLENWIIRSLSFTAPDEGWAIGWDNAKKKPLWLHRSPAGWQRISTKWDDKIEEFNGVFFLRPDLGWAVGGMSWRGDYPGAVFRYQPKSTN